MKNSDIELYDTAIFKYVQDLIPRVVFAPTDRASYTLIKKFPKYKDNIPYPFASIYRDPHIPIDHNRFSNQAIKGHFIKLTTIGTDSNSRNARYVHSIPVTLSYQVDLWGSKSVEILELSQAMLVKLTMKNPVLIVPINPDGEDGRFHILDVDLVDNSDIENEENVGRLYRHTFTFTINAWIKYVDDIVTSKWVCPEIVVTDDISIYDD